MIIDKIKELVSAQLNKPVEDIKDDSKLIEDLGADSLDIVEMLMTLEEEFGVSIPDEDTANMTTIAEIAKVVEAKKNE